MSNEFKESLAQALKPAPIWHTESILEWAPFPAAPVVYLVKVLEERVAVVNQKAANDRKLALQFLSSTSPTHLDSATLERPLSVQPLGADRVESFDLRAVEHPSIGPKGLSKTTYFLSGRLYQTYPLHVCEWMADDSVDDARARMAKFVDWSDWSRAPAPAIGLRLNLLKSKVKTTRGKGFIVTDLKDAQNQVANLEKQGGFVDIQNYQGRVLHLEKRERLTLSVDDTPLDAKDAKAAVDAFARGQLTA